MKVGDLVARSYAWPELIAGIIVDEKEKIILIDNDSGRAGFSCPEITYTGMWSEGTVSTELDLEVELCELIADSDEHK